VLTVSCCPLFAQTPTGQEATANSQKQVTDEVLKKIDQLVQQNEQLEKQNHELIDQINSLRQFLGKSAGPPTNAPKTGAKSPESSTTATAAKPQAEAPIPGAEQLEADGNGGEPPAGPVPSTDSTSGQEQPSRWGAYTPNLGFKVVNTEHGDMNISIYTYVRYLNQLGLNSSYTNYFGTTLPVQRRQDVQLNKVQIKFLGWLFNPDFRYFLYTWTSNASQGLGAQVVVAGNLNYTFNKHFTFSGGIRSLPGTRSVEGNFPFWLGVDSRLIADEFFRPSYTSGIWATGQITDRLFYQVMLGNNLSTLGVSAAQLNNKFDTLSSAVVWMPTTGEFGKGFGDFEDHQTLATRFAGHFTRSNEDTQEQPNSNQFENTQIRLEDGSVIFTPNLLGPGITVTDLTYRMADFDAGVKYHGYSLDAEYFLRWLDNFHGPGTAGLPLIFSHGFQMQASAMVLPKTFQVYLGGSTLYGKYGNPFDFRAGINWFPWHNRAVRWNTEFLYLYKSPVGYTAVPFALGGTGPVFSTTVELAF
ncbi:MAG: hypothetical protein WBY66_09260, partial [Candidatus Acidiferrales bacterium]